jgi:CoA:oxalate CoA-transferase
MTPPCLDRIRVLDLTRVLAGPFCTALLADLGAEVIKIETPEGDDYRHVPPFADGTGGLFLLLNRGKQSVALDLRSEGGRQIVRDLARTSDVLVENFRPGVMQAMGLAYADLARDNPRLIQVSISGFGQQSPLGDMPAYDLVVQALTGFMDLTGDPDGPPMMTGESVADLTTGLFASWATLAALLARERSGLGQHVDVAMFDSLFSFLPAALAQYLYGTSAPRRVGNRHPLGAPFGVFRAADGHYTIAVLNPRQFVRLAAAMGRPELASDPRFAANAARNDNHAALKGLIEDWSTRHGVADVVATLRRHDVPCSEILSVAEAARGAQVAARGLLGGAGQTGGRSGAAMSQPAKFSGMQLAPSAPPPALGADGRAVLARCLGLSGRDIDDLHDRGVLSLPSPA